MSEAKVTYADARAVVSDALAAVGIEACNDNGCRFGPPASSLATNFGCGCWGERGEATPEARYHLDKLRQVIRAMAIEIARLRAQQLADEAPADADSPSM